MAGACVERLRLPHQHCARGCRFAGVGGRCIHQQRALGWGWGWQAGKIYASWHDTRRHCAYWGDALAPCAGLGPCPAFAAAPTVWSWLPSPALSRFAPPRRATTTRHASHADFDWQATCAAVHATGAIDSVVAGDASGTALGSYPLAEDGNHQFWVFSDAYKGTVMKESGEEVEEDIYEASNLGHVSVGAPHAGALSPPARRRACPMTAPADRLSCTPTPHPSPRPHRSSSRARRRTSPRATASASTARSTC